MDTLKEAVRVLGAYSPRFDIWALAGPARASCRAHVMAVLLGVPKVPQAKAGVNALRSEFYARARIAGNCEAVREDTFQAFCRSLNDRTAFGV